MGGPEDQIQRAKSQEPIPKTKEERVAEIALKIFTIETAVHGLDRVNSVRYTLLKDIEDLKQMFREFSQIR